MGEFRIFNNTEQATSFVVGIISIPICVLATILRFATTKSRGNKIRWDDWFALLALFTFLIYTALQITNLISLNGDEMRKVFVERPNVIIQAYKIGYVMNIQTPLNQTFAKLSLLVLYRRVFFVDERFVWLNWSVIVFQTLWCVAMVLIRFFLCNPIQAGFDPILAMKVHAKCLDSQVLLAAGDSVNSAIDFIMIVMAVWMVESMERLSNKDKWKLRFLFVVGGFSGVIGIIRIADAYGSIGTGVKDSTWIIVQMATSIICCCVPISKSIFGKFSVVSSLGRKLGSRIKLFSSGSSKSSRSGRAGRDLSPESAEKHSGSSQKQGAGNNQDWALPHDWEKDVAMGVAKVETEAVCIDQRKSGRQL